MTDQKIQNWLKRRVTTQVLVCRIGSILGLIAGAIVLFVTFWMAYAVLFIVELGVSALVNIFFNHKFHLSHGWRLLVCGLFIIALFWEWLRRSPDDLGVYGEVNAPPGSQTVVFHAGVGGAMAMLLANPQASATMITEILYLGPRLILGSFALLRGASRWRHINVPVCAWVLHSLLVKGGAVTNEEFCANLSGQDWSRIKNDAAQIPGVVYLEKGLSLTEDFRKELATM